MICTAEHCTATAKAKGLCNAHYHARRRLTPVNPCECGCGALALRRFINGHNIRVMPPEEQARRGTFSGESRRGSGTVGYIKLHQRHEHRRVAEQTVGRPLLASEVVHHRDGNKHNNHPDNLEVLTRAEHLRVHRAEMVIARKEKRGY